MIITKYLYHPETGRSYRLDEGHQLRIGRSFDNNIVANDVSVSRHHAVVGMRKGKVYVKDLHSTNGIVVNGDWITDDYEYELGLADEFRVGGIQFRILDESGVIMSNFRNSKMPDDTAIMAAGC